MIHPLTVSSALEPHTRWLVTARALAFCVIAFACASATQTAGTHSARRTLLGDEIRAASVVTAYEAVARLRPEWLRRRGQISVRDPGAGDVLVYLDGMHYGGARALNTIRAEGVLQMEFLSGPEATMRFGTGHAGGAILVQTQ